MLAFTGKHKSIMRAMVVAAEGGWRNNINVDSSNSSKALECI